MSHNYLVTGGYSFTGILKNIPQTDYQHNQRDSGYTSQKYQNGFKVKPVLSN
jgi:hypothetical protein